MPLQRIEIEDRSDCETCTERNKSYLDYMAVTKVKTIGTVWCQECGREYEAIAADEPEQ